MGGIAVGVAGMGVEEGICCTGAVDVAGLGVEEGLSVGEEVGMRVGSTVAGGAVLFCRIG
jgi:hypothetical protein